jgi:hypothetical protein
MDRSRSKAKDLAISLFGASHDPRYAMLVDLIVDAAADEALRRIANLPKVPYPPVTSVSAPASA